MLVFMGLRELLAGYESPVTRWKAQVSSFSTDGFRRHICHFLRHFTAAGCPSHLSLSVVSHWGAHESTHIDKRARRFV